MVQAFDHLRGWLDSALSLVYPEVCQCCGKEKATPAEGYVCGACRAQVKVIQPPFCSRCGLPYTGEFTTAFECAFCREMKCYFSHARSAIAYEGVVLEVIHRYKYQQALWFEPFLAGYLKEMAAPVLLAEQWDAIAPVPLHPVKRNERGFNQAERLARHLSRATSIPLLTKSLRRVRPTRTQTQLTRAERLANMQRAFAVGDPAPVRNRRVVLVDDVRTTGATTNACAKALLESGAAEVCVWTVARGLLH